MRKSIKLLFFVSALAFFTAFTAGKVEASYNIGYGWAKMSAVTTASPRQVTVKIHDSTNPSGSLNLNFYLSVTSGANTAYSTDCGGTSTCSNKNTVVVPLPSNGFWTVRITAPAQGIYYALYYPNFAPYAFSTNQQRTFDVYVVPTSGSATINPTFPAPLPNGQSATKPWFNFDPSYNNAVSSMGGGDVYLQTTTPFNFTSSPVTAPTTITVPAQGLGTNTAYTYTATLRDSASPVNISSQTNLDFGKDTTAPTVDNCTLTATNLKKYFAGDYYTTDETLGVTYTATDNLSGVEEGDVDVSVNTTTSPNPWGNTGLPTAGGQVISPNDPANYTFTYDAVANSALSDYISPKNKIRFRYRVRDKTYNSSGVQSQWSTYSACPAPSSIVSVYVFRHVDLQLVSVELFSDASRTQIINPGSTLLAGDTVYPRVTFKNANLTNSIDGANFTVKFYKNSQNPANSATDDGLCTYTSVAAGETKTCDPPSFEVPASATLYPNAWVDSDDPATDSDGDGVYLDIDEMGIVAEDDDTNNYYMPPVGYEVNIPGWFKTTGGDVGAETGAVTVSQDPLPGSQSSYMIAQRAAGTTESNATISDKSWKIKDYTASLIPQVGGAAGSRLWDYFWPKLQDSVDGRYFAEPNTNKAPGACDVASGWVTGAPAGDATYSFSALTKWGNYIPFRPYVIRCFSGQITDEVDKTFRGFQLPKRNVFIVNGNMTIDGDFTCCVVGNNVNSNHAFYDCSGDALGCKNIYVIKKDLTINTNVKTVDGVFVVGGSFKDYTDISNVDGNKLTINGAVYANAMDIKRKNSDTLLPALEVNFSPNIYFAYNDICGEDSITFASTCYSIGGRILDWNEVAP